MKFLCALLVPGVLAAAILPDAAGPYHRAATVPVPVQDKAVWDEYGLKETDGAKYENGADQMTVLAWRMGDSTASMAAFEWQRPAKSTASKLAPLAAETPDSLLLAHGNYLLSFTGRKPDPAELTAVTDTLKNVDGTPLPPLPGYLPAQGEIPNTARYVTGPDSLAKFFPGVPPSVAAFHYGTEAAVATYRNGKGELPLAIFNYPTHQIAMQRLPEFEKVPGAVVKRSGPLVAVVLHPTDADAAERLLAQVKYQASVTLDEYVPTKKDNIGNLVVNAFVLIGILLAIAIAGGLVVGGLRVLRRRAWKGEEPEALLTLHLDRR